MHGHHDSDHYDVQFTTRQLVMLFGLLIVIVVGVFVGGIVIGRGMAPDAAEAMMAARRTSPGPAPPPAKAAPASVAEAPAEDALRLPIRSEPSPAARAAARAPARETTARNQPARTGRPAAPAPARFATSGPHGLLKPRAACEPDPGDPRTARREPGAGTGGRSAEAGRRREVHHPGRRFPRPRRCRADAGAARRTGNRGLPGGHSGRDLPGARRTVREPRGGPGGGGAARERTVRDPGHESLAVRDRRLKLGTDRALDPASGPGFPSPTAAFRLAARAAGPKHEMWWRNFCYLGGPGLAELP